MSIDCLKNSLDTDGQGSTFVKSIQFLPWVVLRGRQVPCREQACREQEQGRREQEQRRREQEHREQGHRGHPRGHQRPIGGQLGG